VVLLLRLGTSKGITPSVPSTQSEPLFCCWGVGSRVLADTLGKGVDYP
jgi:hypothetical protein